MLSNGDQTLEHQGCACVTSAPTGKANDSDNHQQAAKHTMNHSSKQTNINIEPSNARLRCFDVSCSMRGSWNGWSAGPFSTLGHSIDLQM